MAVYKMTIEYLGLPFSGFQIQPDPDIITIQGEIQEKLSKIYNRPIKICPAGRTDAGVNAIGQVVHFKAEEKFAPRQIQRSLNSLLHPLISVKDVEKAPDWFHARYSALCRKYAYLVHNSPNPRALLRHRTYWYPRKLNLKSMREACTCLVGTHDFRMFAKGVREIKNTVRTLDRSEIFTADELRLKSPPEIPSQLFLFDENLLIFYFEAPSFLRGSIRIMTGNLIRVGIGELSLENLKRMLIPDTSVKSGAHSLPGHGLYFVGADYPTRKADLPAHGRKKR